MRQPTREVWGAVVLGAIATTGACHPPAIIESEVHTSASNVVNLVNQTAHIGADYPASFLDAIAALEPDASIAPDPEDDDL